MIKLGREFWHFLKEQKKWWLIPMLVLLAVLAALLLFAQTSPLSPFMYNNQR